MPRIEGYRFGHVVVDGEEQTRDVIVLPDRVLTGWWRADGHRLVLTDLDDVIEELPERLVVGTGAYAQMRPDPRRRLTNSGSAVWRWRRCRRRRRSDATASSTRAGRPPPCT
jgi:hypothetical protein